MAVVCFAFGMRLWDAGVLFSVVFALFALLSLLCFLCFACISFLTLLFAFAFRFALLAYPFAPSCAGRPVGPGIWEAFVQKNLATCLLGGYPLRDEARPACPLTTLIWAKDSHALSIQHAGGGAAGRSLLCLLTSI